MKAIGFPQNPSDVSKLYDIVNLFVVGSRANINTIKNINWLSQNEIEYKGSYYPAADSRLSTFIRYLTTTCAIPYDVLRGKGSGKLDRGAATCSGVVQAAIVGQKIRKFRDRVSGIAVAKRKPYTDDWTADGFLRWTISIGLLDYDENTDSCTLSSIGARLASCSGPSDPKFKDILGQALLSYPPVCRVLELLDLTYGIIPGSSSDPQISKFKLGSELGFVGESGFTSIPENIWLAEYCTASTNQEKSKVRSDREGTMDKHARMICSWLEQIGWVSLGSQNVSGSFCGITYSAYLPCFYITIKGHNAYVNSKGHSKNPRVPKNVYLGTLATKSSDADYLSSKRAYILDCISGGKAPKDLVAIQTILSNNGFTETTSTIHDDLQGLKRIGIDISMNSAGQYHVDDIIQKLTLPKVSVVTPTTIIGIINSLRAVITNVDHKYLNLINYSLDSNKDRDLEQLTLELLTNELGFKGKWLGGSSKPDGIIAEGSDGLIIDTKAYSKGYNLPRAQKDEMFRYISDFVFKNTTVNPTRWWNNFPNIVSFVCFTFVSSDFTATVPAGLSDISNRTVAINGGTAINGGAITTKVLLEKAEAVKSGYMSKVDFLRQFNSNKIVV